jgi:hypothetical protein
MERSVRGKVGDKKEVAFLKKSSAKDFCKFYMGFWNVPRTDRIPKQALVFMIACCF